MTKHREAGQAVAELAILIPLLLTILLGCLDLGRAFSVWLTLTNGAREGARYAASNPDRTDGEILARAQADIVAEGLSASALTVGVSPALAARTGGQPVVITATYSLPMVSLYLFGAQPLDIRASAQMMILTGGS